MTCEMDKKWMCSLDEEYWQASAYFDTKEEAVRAGLESIERFNTNPEDEYLDDEMGSTPEEVVDSFYVGQVLHPDLPFCVDDLIECMQESAYENEGDFAQGYLDDITREHKKELDDLVRGFFVKRGYLPTWYTVCKIDEISI